MKVGDIIKHKGSLMNGIVVVMPPHHEPHGAILVQWFDAPFSEWCSKGSIRVISEKV